MATVSQPIQAQPRLSTSSASGLFPSRAIRGAKNQSGTVGKNYAPAWTTCPTCFQQGKTEISEAFLGSPARIYWTLTLIALKRSALLPICCRPPAGDSAVPQLPPHIGFFGPSVLYALRSSATW